jgi:lysophospholipase L1-like esterase
MYRYKKIMSVLGLALLVSGYLFAVNWSIYHRISQPGLRASDTAHQYVFNGDSTKENGLVYSAIGDSLTSGVGVTDYKDSYPYLVAQNIASASIKVTHLNFSYPGAKTDNVIRDLLPGAVVSNPDIVTVLIGTNDVHDGMSEEEFKNNYKVIISELASKTRAKILLISIPYIGSESLLLPPYNWYFKYRVDRFNRVIKELAEQNSLVYIDLTTPTSKSLKSAGPYYSADDFHPSSVGYKDWSDIVYANLSR